MSNSGSKRNAARIEWIDPFGQHRLLESGERLQVTIEDGAVEVWALNCVETQFRFALSSGSTTDLKQKVEELNMTLSLNCCRVVWLRS